MSEIKVDVTLKDEILSEIKLMKDLNQEISDLLKNNNDLIYNQVFEDKQNTISDNLYKGIDFFEDNILESIESIEETCIKLIEEIQITDDNVLN